MKIADLGFASILTVGLGVVLALVGLVLGVVYGLPTCAMVGLLIGIGLIVVGLLFKYDF
jgi:hypothetical protein